MQAIAREDKGILGKDWNKSDKTFFRTASYNPTVSPEEVKRDLANSGNLPSSVVNSEVKWSLEESGAYSAVFRSQRASLSVCSS